MSSPFIGEIRMFAGNFAPVGWKFCDGSLQSIAENDTLFTLIGTTYGGDGQSTFALPDLRSRVPVHVGQGFALGQNGGEESVTLTISQIPAHSHVPACNSGNGVATTPTGNVWAASADSTPYATAQNTAMNAAVMGMDGGSQPHDNMIPFLAINFIIALEGIFPSQT